MDFNNAMQFIEDRVSVVPYTGCWLWLKTLDRDGYAKLGGTSEHKNKFGYVKYEEYPESEALAGRFWTTKLLASGCNGSTKMGRALSETYARDPKFYGATYCCNCGKHFPVEEFVWNDGQGVGS